MKSLKIASVAVVVALISFAFTSRFTHPDCSNPNQLFWFKVNTASVLCSSVAIGDITPVPASGTLQADAESDFQSVGTAADFAIADDLLTPCPGLQTKACYVGYTFSQLTRIQQSPGVFVWRPTTVQTKTCCITKP